LWYSTQVYELLNIADVVICKAGPATIFEVLSQGKPMIIYKKFWPQEEGNVEYILKHNAGIFEPKLEFLPGLVDTILLNEEMQHTFKKHIQSLQYHNGLDECVDYIFSFS
jgi:UDP-N-acetylglucosamine:LPS N-acetylglucosamine transferase